MPQRKRKAPSAPPTVQMLRTSERKEFRRCPLRWDWSYNKRYTPPFAANALWFGEGIHVTLATWYQKGTKRSTVHPADIFAKWVGSERRRIFTQPNPNTDETEIVDARELGTAMLDNYVKTYGKDEHYSFIATEQTFQILINEPMRGMGDPTPLVNYVGTFDGVYRDLRDGTVWLIEHKTAKAIQTNHLTLDDQGGSYWMVANQVLAHQGLIKPTERIEGIMYNFLRKALPDQRPQNAQGMYLNKDGSVSRSQPPPYFLREEVTRTRSENRSQLQRIQREAFIMRGMRSGDIPIIKNPTRDCPWDCPFLGPCEVHEMDEDYESVLDSTMIKRDPYEAHNKSAAE